MDLSNEILEIEKSIRALKSARPFTQFKTFYLSDTYMVKTGLYRIDYEDAPNAIFSQICFDPLAYYAAFGRSLINSSYLRAANGASQIVEVVTFHLQNPDTSVELPMIVISNAKVKNITRIG